MHDLVTDTLRRLVDEVPDDELLRRFASAGDQDAFAALVRRHGPLVLGVCRRLIGNPDAAEDAFQATFLVLARRAVSLTRPGALTGWLYGVARRVAQRVRRRERRPPLVRPSRTLPDPFAELTARELLLALEEEIERLPEAYRLAVVLCCLHGLSQEEAARQLGWGAGSLKGRLERGRARLRERLAQRGIAPAAALGAALATNSDARALPPTLTQRTLVTLTNPGPAPAALAKGALRAMRLSRMTFVFTVAFAAAVIATAGLSAGLFPHAEPPPVAPETVLARTAGADVGGEKADNGGKDLPPTLVARLGTLRFQHNGFVSALSFNSAGTILVSGDYHGRAVRLWDAATGEELRRLDVPGFVAACALSADGKVVAGGGIDAPVVLWNAATGKELRKLGLEVMKQHGFDPEKGKPLGADAPVPPIGGFLRVKALAFSPDGKMLAGACDDYRVRLWNPATGKELRAIEGPPSVPAPGDQQFLGAVGHGGFTQVAFSADGKVLAALAWDRTVHLWDAGTAKPIGSVAGPRTETSAFALAPDGKTVLTGGGAKPLALWEMASGKKLREFPVGRESVLLVALSADAKSFASGNTSGVVRVWDAETGKERCRGSAGAGSVTALVFSPDGKRLGCATQDNQIRVLDTATGKEVVPQKGHRDGLDRVAFSPDGKTIATAGKDLTVRVWKTATGEEIGRLGDGKALEFSNATFSPDGKLLATCGGTWFERATGRVLLWDATTLRKVGEIKDPSRAVYAVVFAPDGKSFLTLSSGDEVRQWETGSGTFVRQIGAALPVHGAAFSPDGTVLATGGGDGKVRFWDTTSGTLRWQFGGGAGSVVVSGFTPDGRYVFGRGDGGAVVAWELASGGERFRFTDDKFPPYGAALSPNGRFVAFGGADNLVRLRDTADGRELARLEGHRNWIHAMAFAPSGNLLVSASGDTTAIVWDCAKVLSPAKPRATNVDDRRGWWENLTTRDAAKGYRAVCDLAAAEGADTFLGEKLRPAAPVDPASVTRLIAELGAEEFAARERAEKALADLGDLAGPALREALGGTKSAEVRKRMDALLANLVGPVRSSDVLRQIRAVEVLERVGTPEAKRVLKRLAGGAEEARLTREAKATLNRLDSVLAR